MGIIGGKIGSRLLHAICPTGEAGYLTGKAYKDRSKIEVLFGSRIWDELVGKVVIDFGCGQGEEAIDIAKHGAQTVIGLDLRERLLVQARLAAEKAGVSERCIFKTKTRAKADVIMSLDAFEHFDDPSEVLRIMRTLLTDEGRVIVMFGPTWYHPLGGHQFSVFPWAHLIFKEHALIRWRSSFKNDGATRFSEVEGGLNQMTIRRFERVVEASEFEFESFEAVPIRNARLLHNRLTREFLSAVVHCRLVPRTISKAEWARWSSGSTGLISRRVNSEPSHSVQSHG
jgi:SAM-dependent methyltransferase